MDLTLRNTIITGNSSSDGGGLFFSGDGNALTIISSTFSNNTPHYDPYFGYFQSKGGGAAIIGSNSSVSISDSIFSNNEVRDSFGGGGGLFLSVTGSTSSIEIRDTIVSGNQSIGQSSNAGGIYLKVTDVPNAVLEDLQVVNNDSDDDGGGIFIDNSGSEVLIRNGTITGNTAKDGDNFGSIQGGGGLTLITRNGADIRIENSTIAANEAIGAVAGGIFIEGTTGTTVEIVNTTISGNRAGRHGGGIAIDTNFFLGVSIDIRHSTITNNRADWDEDFSGSGGGIRRGNVTLDHTIVAGNFNGKGTTRDDIDGSVTSGWSLIGDDSGATVTQVVGTINQIGTSASPIDPRLGVLKLNGGPTQTHAPLCNSPALDAGDPSLMEGEGGEDQRGFERVFDLPNNAGGPVDIGAVEFQDVDLHALVADLDDDGDVDGDDLDVWKASYGVGSNGDTDGDGDTDGADFLNWQRQLCQQWAASTVALLQLQTNLVFVTTTLDEDDGDYSLGDLSLREAVRIANVLQVPTTIILPSGHYLLDRIGNEGQDTGYNDLDITGDMTILGYGPGLSVIDSSGLSSMSNQLYNRAFHVEGTGTRLAIDGVTLTGGDSSANLSGTAVLVSDYAVFELTDSAVVNNNGTGNGVAIRSSASDVTIRRSVFTNNVSTQNDAALYATKKSYYAGSVTIGESLFALNQADNGTVTPNVWVQNGITKINDGNNLYDDASGNFFNQNPGAGDHLGTTDYVVTTIADTFDHTDDYESLSLREAIDLANNDTGASEVWLPAWDFVLTRDRGTNVTDTDVSYGDLDIKDSLVIRGVTGATSVAWKAGVVDDIFDLLGDFTGDGISSIDDGDVDGADYLAWLGQNGSTGGTYSADGDDDGDVDGDDLSIWSQYYGNSLDVFDVLV